MLSTLEKSLTVTLENHSLLCQLASCDVQLVSVVMPVRC
jgi:hypothetical protein